MIRLRTMRLSYANVVATLALFVALGGASYAAIVLPDNSVHQRQLAFPLGVASKTIDAPRFVPVWFCPPGAPCAVEIPRRLASVVVFLKRPAKLLVLGTSSFSPPTSLPRSNPIGLTLGAAVQTGNLVQSVGGVEQSHFDGANPTLQFWVPVSAPAGRHVIGLDVLAQGTPRPAIRVNAASLTVVVLPAAG